MKYEITAHWVTTTEERVSGTQTVDELVTARLTNAAPIPKKPGDSQMVLPRRVEIHRWNGLPWRVRRLTGLNVRKDGATGSRTPIRHGGQPYPPNLQNLIDKLMEGVS